MVTLGAGAAPGLQCTCFAWALTLRWGTSSRPRRASSTHRASGYGANEVVSSTRFGLLENGDSVNLEQESALVPEHPANSQALQEFALTLEESGIDTSGLGRGSAKSLEELYWETFVDHECTLETGDGGRIKRVVSMVQIQLMAQDIFGTWRGLISTMQFLHDGRQRKRKELLVKKIRDGENWENAIRSSFSDRLNMNDELQDRHLIVDKSSYEYREEEISSAGYTGLLTLYRIHKVSVRIRDATHPELERLGLPECRDFATMEGTFSEKQMGAHLRMWTWEHSAGPPSAKVAGSPDGKAQRRRVPIPTPLSSGRVEASSSNAGAAVPSAGMHKLLSGERTEWNRAEAAARRIREPGYSLREFHEDVTAAFPELRLYLASDDQTTSGRTGDDEYQRTIGALYALYWLMRLDIDGKEGFTFGVDADWLPKRPPSETKGVAPSDEKRLKFYQLTNWDWFTELFVGARLLSPMGTGYSVCFERMVAMLALTAIHDIMKVPALLPTVQTADAPYHGYQAKDQIGDHDVALGYVLEKYPEALPSFEGLNAAQRKAVVFTQVKLEYNQGWLVQAEAPPGALFRTFKELLRSGGVEACDVSFYFVHWLTDLAGAEPYPLEGAEKFVLMFPHSVLQSFLRSFPFVQKLAQKSETEVFEDYLRMRWKEQSPPMDSPLPLGKEGIAVLRLLCQAQGNARAVVRAFHALPDEDRKLLSHEMALTGVSDQNYAQVKPRDGEAMNVGPAFLIYYAPALLQKGKEAREAPLALRCLCEVYRQARSLWPADAARQSEHVVVRIDTIKDQSSQQIRDAMCHGEAFLLVKHSEREAFIERHPLQKMNDLNERGLSHYRVLVFPVLKGIVLH